MILSPCPKGIYNSVVVVSLKIGVPATFCFMI